MEYSNKRMTVMVAVFIILIVGVSVYIVKDRSFFDTIINQIRGQKDVVMGIE
ncbi:MAG: hypothetical protein HY228_00335, partial [Candidatus Yonathbacteria bacterium]|nr:hypothetical protein [Candidatus Yonathbacteria bacterium]